MSASVVLAVNSSPDGHFDPPGKPCVLVTGASGFIGRAVCHALVNTGYRVIGQVFRHSAPPGVTPLHLDLTDLDDLATVCPAVDAVIHLAGLAHVPADCVGRNLVWRTNVIGTHALARVAAQWQAHIIYLSSAKVLGESGEWNDDAPLAPADFYAESKVAAEQAIRATRNLTYTILRPPLVYGPGVRGNFLRLLHWVNAGWPLPLATLNNPRSLLYVKNLASAITACLHNPAAAAGHTWLVSDGATIGVASLFRQLAAALGRPARLFPLETHALLQIARWCRMSAEVERLTGQFVIHDREIRSRLGWMPPYELADALRTTADWFACEHLHR